MRAAAPLSPLLTVPNVTAHQSMSSVPTSYYTIWHYNCLLILKGHPGRRQRAVQSGSSVGLRGTGAILAIPQNV